MTSNDLVRVYDSGTPESRERRGDGAGDVALGALFSRRVLSRTRSPHRRRRLSCLPPTRNPSLRISSGLGGSNEQATRPRCGWDISEGG